MKKIRINMLSMADTVKGQGVGTAYLELIELLKDNKNFEIVKNKGLKYDIMHAHTVDPISYMKQRLSKGKSLTYVHCLPNTLEGAIKAPKFFMKAFEKFAKKMYLKSDYLVTVNPDYPKIFEEWGYKKENIFYIPNFVSSNRFFEMSKKEIKDIRKEYGYNDSDFIVISVGQLHNGKGIKDFFKCAKDNPHIKFLWVGGFNFGAFMEGYEDTKKMYENPYPNLKFTGIVPREDVNRLLNASDVFFLPSLAESFSLVTVEASNTGKPIVLRDLDVYNNIFFDNYLKGNNHKDFSKILNELKDNKKLYKEYSNKSINIKKLYSKENALKMWEDLYKKL